MTRTHATIAKKTPLPPLVPPQDIRSNTAQRRQWLDDALAALPEGVQGRITGTGSYQQVSRWQVAEVAGRERLRGTCQVCGGQQVVTDGEGLALHGYQRPRWGYVVGRCGGTAHAPAELSVALTHETIETLERCLAEARQREAAMLSAHNGRDLYHLYAHVRGAIGEAARELYQNIDGYEMHLKFLRDRVLPQHGQALTREVVA